MQLKSLRPSLATLDLSAAKAPPKQADAELQTAAHRAWAADVLRRADYRCESCGKPGAVADHKRERKDGGALLDPANGQCLCVSCNTAKGLRARERRLSRGQGG